ncbi:ABC transporter ATP-binding protein [Micromonospora sp. CPCC 205371]|nr:ABC transporter ATP-binding protein [Micromonospora sp. CPCC 205371]
MVSALRLRGVSKRYPGGAEVLTAVDLEVHPGDVIGVMGDNGSGKTTLLKILVGLSLPTAGTVSGRPPIVAYVPERFPSHHRMSALSYLRHMGRIRGLSTRTADALARELLDRLALAGGETTALRRLSKGNAQKVALAQALLVRPHLLVLDEPWSGLDASAHGVLGELIDEVAQAGGAVVFTDHRESVVAANASTGVRIDQGRVAPERLRSSTVHSGAAEVELVPGSDGPPAAVDWSALPGILEVRGRPGVVAVRVTDEHCDRVLFTAIRQGWSVASVRRTSWKPADAWDGGR